MALAHHDLTRPYLHHRVELANSIASRLIPALSAIRLSPSVRKLDLVCEPTNLAATSAATSHSRSDLLTSSALRVRGSIKRGTSATRSSAAASDHPGSVERFAEDSEGGSSGCGGAAVVNVLDRGTSAEEASPLLERRGNALGESRDGFFWSDSEDEAGERRENGGGDGDGGNAMRDTHPTTSSSSSSSSRLLHVLSVINDSTKWVATVATAVTVIATHNRAAAWFVVGAVLNVANGKALKRILRHERPETARGKKADPGMPSSHALSLSYLSVYGAVAALQRFGMTPYTITGASLLVSLAAFLAILRVVLGLHTPAQIAVGWVMGTAVALLWSHAASSLPQLPFLQQHAAWVDAGVVVAGMVMFSLFVLVEVRKWLAKAGGGVMRQRGEKG
ncbi:unnamed protein product [Closterium sp. Yama58-4]|nr:unnamed protein product [Closterium sp. Yama58-4]